MKVSALATALLLAVSPLAANAADEASTSSMTFALPADWMLNKAGDVTHLTAPEGDLSVAFVDVGKAADQTAATAVAWKVADPAFARKVRLAAKAPATDGWDETWTIDYEVSPNEKLILRAYVFRRGDNWSVAMFRGSEATFSKRLAAVRTIAMSLHPAGVAPEDFTGKAAAPFDAARREALKQFWKDAMAAYGVPGIGYAIIDRNGIVDEGGIGLRTIGKPDPVDAHTRFMIASNTKGMTTLLLAKLVDQGKLRWDEPVVKAYPQFKLGDPSVRDAIQIRHLICACTGMPRQDMEWIMTGDLQTKPDRVFDLLAPMKPTTKFGDVFQYSNLLASAAGYVAGKVEFPKLDVGAAYDKAMKTEVFDPLGMTETTFSKRVAVGGNHADPHDIGLDGKIAVGTIDKSDSIYFARPAGGAWSSAHDVALYALDELREGVLPSGKRLVSTAALLERRAPGVPTGEATKYGMGLETSKRWGVTMIDHGGGMPGYKTDWIILPDAGVGVVILNNGETGSDMLTVTKRRLVELLYGARPDAVPTMQANAARIRAAYAKAAAELKLPPDPKAVAKLATRYVSPALGTITVKRSGTDVIFDFGSFSSRMATKRNEDGTTSFVMADPTVTDMSFVAKSSGQFDTLVMRDEQHEYEYAPAK
jgi:CubicO group peptidase (beta-lactamase class C family)